jgi:hypothetical protein
MGAAPPLQRAYAQLSLAYQVMAGSAFSLETYRQAKLGGQLRIYARTRDRLDAIAGHCCCDECLTLLVGVPRSSIIIATRRLGTEPGYAKYVGCCALCDEHGLVTQAAAHAPLTPLSLPDAKAED